MSEGKKIKGNKQRRREEAAGERTYLEWDFYSAIFQADLECSMFYDRDNDDALSKIDIGTDSFPCKVVRVINCHVIFVTEKKFYL